MIPVILAFGELLGVIVLMVYGLADNERIYASIFAFLTSAMLSFMLGYQLLFGLIVGEKYLEVAAVTYTDTPLGYFFIMVGIGISILTFAVMVDGILKNREGRR